jgi:hypothetical protein
MRVPLTFEIQRFHFLLHAAVGMVKASVVQLFNILGSKCELDQGTNHCQCSLLS